MSDGGAAASFSEDGAVVDDAFRERMNVLIERSGGPGELARKSGLSRRVIDKYRSGHSDPSRERLIALARGGRVALLWLATGDGPLEPDPIHPGAGSDEHPDFVALPRYDLQAAAGTPGRVAEPEHIIDYIYFRRDWLRSTLSVNPAALAILVAEGDSMADTIRPGDSLIIDAGDPKFRGDGVYILNVDDALMVKRVAARLAGGFRITSDNSKYSEVLDVGRDEIGHRVRLIGKVLWVGGPI
jgi:phage repressor protein C with HTH and peptisase S24 domain